MSVINPAVNGIDVDATQSTNQSPPTRFLDLKEVSRADPRNAFETYEIVGELGRGAFGIVYRARDPQLDRCVAIKVLQVGPTASEEELARFHAEAEALGRLQHANIVQVYNTGIHQGMPYLVMELVEGGSLLEKLGGHPLHPREAAARIETLARAMHLAHTRGIVHRDLKPANILVSADGTLKVTDFGLAKRLDRSLGLSQTGQALGTPSYMAPEQADGRKEIGPGADVYSLGAILYEMLTGRPPFRGPDILAVLDQVRSTDPLSPSRLVPRLPRDLCTICLKCLEKAPARRYVSALDLADDLRRYLDGQTIVARPASAPERLWRVVQRRPWQAGLVTASFLVIALAGVLSLVLVEKSRQDKIAEMKREQEQQAHEQEAQLRKFSQEESTRSLEALDGILALVVKGPLSNKPGLNPLYQKLLGYYDELIKRDEHSAMAPRDRLANACRRLGQLIRKTGKLAEARKALNKAEQLYVGLIRAAPREPRYRRELARTRQERGRALEGMGEGKLARKDYESALALLEQLHREVPGNTQYQRDLSEVLHWMAGLCAGTETDGGYREALDFYTRALELRKELCRLPDATGADRGNLASTHAALGDLRLATDDLPRADTAYWQAHHLREKLAKEEGENDDAHFQLARSYANFARFQGRARALDTALNFLEQALQQDRKLVERNPAVMEYQTDLADVRNRIAELLLLRGAAGDPERRRHALELAHDAQLSYEQQQKIDGQGVNIGRGLAESLSLRARLLADSGSSHAEARLLLSRAAMLLEALPRQGQTAEAHYQLAAARALQAELCPPEYREGLVIKALAHLEQAEKKHFRRLHPDDVRQDRAFKVLRDRKEFEQLLAAAH